MKGIQYFLFISFLILFDISTCYCQWSTDPAENNMIAWNLYNPIIVSDMKNGIIVVGQMHPQYSKIYAQRMSVDGRRLWPGDMGVKVSYSPHFQWLTPMGNSPGVDFAVSDGAGGCYIGYQIARFIGFYGPGTDYYDINAYIQRLNPDGNRLFGADGFMLMPEEDDSTAYDQSIKHWCPDGHHGIYVSWYRLEGWGHHPEKDGSYLARISPTGEFIWGPKKMHVYFEVDYIPYLDSDLNLNLYFYLGETTPKTPDEFLKINAETGEILSRKEVEIGVGHSGFNGFYDYCFSTNYSAIFAFRDFRSDTLRIQKLDEDGNKIWGEDPLIVSNAINGYMEFDVESDQSGGAYVYYHISAADTFRLTHFNHQGQRLWDRSFYSKYWLQPHNEQLSVDSDGNAFVLTQKAKYLTKVSYDGDILWTTMVTSRDTVASFWYHGLKADSTGGCIVLWAEIGKLYSQFSGFRAQRIDRNGQLGGPTSVPTKYVKAHLSSVAIKAIYPNPFNETVIIQVSLPYTQQVTLKIYDLLGKEVKKIKSEILAAGVHSFYWNGTNHNGDPVASGVYFIMLTTSQSHLTQKIVLIK